MSIKCWKDIALVSTLINYYRYLQLELSKNLKTLKLSYDIVTELSQSSSYLPIEMTATSLTRALGGSHSATNGSTAYLAKLRHIIAICDGFSTNVDT